MRPTASCSSCRRRTRRRSRASRTSCSPGRGSSSQPRACPVGDYTRTVLETLGLSAALDNVVSNEDDVKGVAGKVALGEADAGFVYATDVTPVADRVLAVELPDDAQPPIEYQVAVVADSDDEDAAARFRRDAPQAGAGARRSSGPGSSFLRSRRRVRHRRRSAPGRPRRRRRACARSANVTPPSSEIVASRTSSQTSRSVQPTIIGHGSGLCRVAQLIGASGPWKSRTIRSSVISSGALLSR